MSPFISPAFFSSFRCCDTVDCDRGSSLTTSLQIHSFFLIRKLMMAIRAGWANALQSSAIFCSLILNSLTFVMAIYLSYIVNIRLIIEKSNGNNFNNIYFIKRSDYDLKLKDFRFCIIISESFLLVLTRKRSGKPSTFLLLFNHSSLMQDLISKKYLNIIINFTNLNMSLKRKFL